MNDFLGKYYPSIKRKLHESRIENLREILSKEIELYNKTYKDEIHRD